MKLIDNIIVISLVISVIFFITLPFTFPILQAISEAIHNENDRITYIDNFAKTMESNHRIFTAEINEWGDAIVDKILPLRDDKNVRFADVYHYVQGEYKKAQLDGLFGTHNRFHKGIIALAVSDVCLEKVR